MMGLTPVHKIKYLVTKYRIKAKIRIYKAVWRIKYNIIP